MRSLSIALFSGVTLFAVPVFAADIAVTSRVGAVIIYPDGAQVSRVMDVDIGAGASTLVISGLPSTIDPNSLRVEGASTSQLGNSALSIVSLDTRMIPANPIASIDPALKAKIDGLKAERDALIGKIEALELQKTTIQRYAEAGPESLKSNEKPVDANDWVKGWNALSDGLMKVNEQLLALRTQTKRVDDDILALTRAKPVEVSNTAPLYETRIAVEAPVALKAGLKLVYQVRGANWTPLYDARLTTEGLEKPKLALTRRAQIVQRTGEDWQDVSLQLSTVRLQRLTAAPVVTTSTLNLIDPAVMLSQLEKSAARVPAPLAAAPMGRVQNSFMEDADSSRRKDKSELKEPVAATEMGAGVEAGAYQAVFNVPGKVIVPKDGTQKTFALSTLAVEPELALKASPAFDAAAYLEASFVNSEDAPLLAGQVMIHRDGTFVGRDTLKLIAAGDKAVLGFGADDAVKITRVPVKKRENDAGFWGSTRSDVQDFKTSAKNLHKFPVKLTIVDRIPISENTAIVVEPLATNTSPTEKTVEDQRGVMAWVYELKPNEQRDVRLGWRLKWPVDRELFATNKAR
jgi:uncharacterized protein (TIGR02231 family)